VTAVERLRFETYLAARRLAGTVLFGDREDAIRWAVIVDTLGGLLTEEMGRGGQ
jgi:hypothetical protein